MKRTEVISVQLKTVPHIYNTTCKEMFPNIDAAMIDVQFIWMTTSRRICVEREEIAKFKPNNIKHNFIAHNKVVVKSSKFHRTAARYNVS